MTILQGNMDIEYHCIRQNFDGLVFYTYKEKYEAYFIFLSMCVVCEEQNLEIRLHSVSWWGLESNRLQWC